MLDKSQFLEVLETYLARLNGLLNAFQRASAGNLYLPQEKDALARQTIHELIDLFNDSIKNNSYSARVVHIANEGITGWPDLVSMNCIRELISLCEAVKARVQRNPEILKGHIGSPQMSSDYWKLLHPTVVAFAKSRMAAGHYADAVESCFKELNNVVKLRHQENTGQELDGVALMRKAFKLDSPSITLAPLIDDTGRNIQQGYLDLFAGSMAGIRNPKAHGNIEISAERALHFLFLASLLFSKLDEAA